MVALCLPGPVRVRHADDLLGHLVKSAPVRQHRRRLELIPMLAVARDHHHHPDPKHRTERVQVRACQFRRRRLDPRITAQLVTRHPVDAVRVIPRRPRPLRRRRKRIRKHRKHKAALLDRQHLHCRTRQNGIQIIAHANFVSDHRFGTATHPEAGFPGNGAKNGGDIGNRPRRRFPPTPAPHPGRFDRSICGLRARQARGSLCETRHFAPISAISTAWLRFPRDA